MDQQPTCSQSDQLHQQAVLHLVLSHHPTQLTMAELLRAMCRSTDDASESDPVERAVEDLTGAGLLHRHGEFVLPTAAALRFEELYAL